MALMKCKECGSQVSTKAKACPTCGAKPPKKTIGTLSGLIIIGLAVVVFSKIFGGGSSGSSANQVASADRCNDPTMAFVMSQNFAKKQLKSPASAKFPYISDDGVSVVKTADCQYQVVAFVDSQNSFGAVLRSTYSVNMESTRDGRRWTAKNLVIK
ncbi:MULTISPECIES: zinc ribbon domain-containing protein [Pseudomonas]|uniref:zinc ribbon domain-containing protein n=1 Tax=Pseudomonas TaxID=286 RepID=UPI0004DACFD3|nr:MULTISPECIES: zinc ribbon domain-containing protein [Pseudomonas]KES23077.1 hypothetical protein FG99_16065 [Pseudomonas sp. AAC]